MYWRPKLPKPDGEYVNDILRHALARRLWDQDGSLSSGPDGLDSDDLSYLERIRDAGITGAQDLIDAIRKYGTIEIWIER
jgi:hypothetical protein